MCQAWLYYFYQEAFSGSPEEQPPASLCAGRRVSVGLLLEDGLLSKSVEMASAHGWDSAEVLGCRSGRGNVTHVSLCGINPSAELRANICILSSDGPAASVDFSLYLLLFPEAFKNRPQTL